METFPHRRHNKFTFRTVALSLVEVIIALAVVSLVFVYINNTTFASLRTVKKLELEDKMLNLANEGIEVIKKEKSINWNTFANKFPGVNSTAFVQYTISGVERESQLQQITGSSCTPPATQTALATFVFSSSCEYTAVGTTGADSLFGRVIKLEQIDAGRTYARLSVTVACIQGKCLAEDFKPIVLTTYVYRTN